MKINFYATLRQITGAKMVDLPLGDKVTVGELIQEIIRTYPPMRSELLDASGQLYPHVHIFVNGRDAPYLAQGLETILAPTDTINIFPAVGGG
ncbi:MAG: MoaD/ThiS family protein [Chloroflexi bacterium]|nr:MoaD/ThiS family protein [Chloroflexota bacterium]